MQTSQLLYQFAEKSALSRC